MVSLRKQKWSRLSIFLAVAAWLTALQIGPGARAQTARTGPVQPALNPGGLQITVVDTNGDPVKSCGVYRFSKNRSNSAYTDQNGKAFLNMDSSEGPSYLWAQQRDIYMAAVVKSPNKGGELRIQLKPAGSIHLEATGPEGQPIAIENGNTYLLAGEDCRYQSGSYDRRRDALVITCLPEGEYVVQPGLSQQDQLDYGIPTPLLAKVTSGKVTRLKVALQPGVRVKMRLQDSKTNKTVFGVRATLQALTTPGVPPAAPDPAMADEARRKLNSVPVRNYTQLYRIAPDGWAHVRMLPGTYTLQLQSQEYELTEGTNNRKITISEEPEQALTVPIGPLDMQTVTGVVLDDMGNPIANANISINGAMRVSMDHYRTAADGSFSAHVQTYAADQPRPLRVQVQHHARGLMVMRTLNTIPAEPVKIVLQPTVPVIGRVLDDAEKPIQGAYVNVTRIVNIPEQGYTQTLYGGGQNTDEDGSFTLRGVEGGSKIKLQVRKNGYTVAERELTIGKTEKADKPITLDDFIISKLDRKLEGVVADANGNPVPGVYVYLSGEGLPGNSIKTDANGAFTYMVGKAPLTARAQGQGDLSALKGEVKVSATDTKVRIVLKAPELPAPGPNDVVCTIVGPDDQPVIGAQVITYHEASYWGYERSGWGGRMLIRGSRDKVGGFIMVRHERLNLVAVVPADKTGPKMTIKLSEGGRVSGQVVSADGAAVSLSQARLNLRLSDKTTATLYGSVSGTSFSMSGLPEGDYTVDANASTEVRQALGIPLPGKVTVKAGETQKVSLKLDPGKEVTFAIVDDKTDKPIARAQISINQRVQPHRSEHIGTLTAGDDGLCRMRMGLGDYQVYLQNSKTHKLQRSLTVKVTDKEKQTLKIACTAMVLLTIEGKVVDPQGKPLAGARIYASGMRYQVRRDTASATDGTFVVIGELSGRGSPAFFHVTHKDTQMAADVAMPKKSGPFTITLQPATVITGTVVDDAGKPCANAHVNAQAVRSGGRYSHSYSVDSTRTDEDGAFKLGPQIGTVQVSAYLDGYVNGSTSLTLAPAQKPGDEKTVKLTLARLDRKLTCTLLNEAGVGLVNTRVSLSVQAANQAWSRSDSRQTDANGVVTFNTGHGALTLTARTRDQLRLTGTVQVAADAHEVRIPLKAMVVTLPNRPTYTPPPSEPPTDAAWNKVDTVDKNLTWYGLKSGVALMEGEAKKLTRYPELLGMKDLPVDGIAFGPNKVWIGTKKGLIAWDRKTKAFALFLVNGVFADAPVSALEIKDKSLHVTVSVKDKPRAFVYDLAKQSWQAPE